MTQRKNQDLDDQSQLMRNEMVSDAFRQASRIVRQLDRDGAFDFIFNSKAPHKTGQSGVLSGFEPMKRKTTKSYNPSKGKANKAKTSKISYRSSHKPATVPAPVTAATTFPAQSPASAQIQEPLVSQDTVLQKTSAAATDGPRAQVTVQPTKPISSKPYGSRQLPPSSTKPRSSRTSDTYGASSVPATSFEAQNGRPVRSANRRWNSDRIYSPEVRAYAVELMRQGELDVFEISQKTGVAPVCLEHWFKLDQLLPEQPLLLPSVDVSGNGTTIQKLWYQGLSPKLIARKTNLPLSVVQYWTQPLLAELKARAKKQAEAQASEAGAQLPAATPVSTVKLNSSQPVAEKGTAVAKTASANTSTTTTTTVAVADTATAVTTASVATAASAADPAQNEATNASAVTVKTDDSAIKGKEAPEAIAPEPPKTEPLGKQAAEHTTEPAASEAASAATEGAEDAVEVKAEPEDEPEPELDESSKRELEALEASFSDAMIEMQKSLVLRLLRQGELTQKEIAHFTAINASLVIQWRMEAKIPAIRISDSLKVRKEQATKMLQDGGSTPEEIAADTELATETVLALQSLLS
ncbi:MAG TPA: hypothetical protein H9850_05695 [Candidatus Anaerobiospirillum pullistercoris]|uniref:Uncharacterized protein n=1 Tax=Candidatus Anaerobiospirillum pullistercoris TaxID=2838452 RepID=A0A9D1WD06_9GAMM|nr:hypothetical protein [Candidatus Anaerobiospirillum pullistercoris]